MSSSSFLLVPSPLHSASSPGAPSRLTFHPIDADAELSSSDDSSSIGTASDDEDPVLDGQDEEAQSKSTGDGGGSSSSFASLSSLEDSLPIKRGLSNYFVGKSRSFSNLADCANGEANEIGKPESPFNRKRRLEIACRFSFKRRASCSSLISPAMLPSLLSPDQALHEEDEKNYDNDEDSGGDDEYGGDHSPLKSHRSFSLFI